MLTPGSLTRRTLYRPTGHRLIESTRIYLHLATGWLADEYRRATDRIDSDSFAHCLYETWGGLVAIRFNSTSLCTTDGSDNRHRQPMRARDLATPQISVRPTATFSEAVLAMSQRGAVLVVDDSGKLLGVVSDAVLLRGLLPAYVQVNEQLAGVLDEHTAEKLFERVKNRVITELLRDLEELPRVAGDDSLIEVSSVMLRTASPLVAVEEQGKITGGISLKDLLDHLVR